MVARRICLQMNLSFSTAYHTRFPEYIHARWRIPMAWTEWGMKVFHAPSQNIMVSVESELTDLRPWFKMAGCAGEASQL